MHHRPIRVVALDILKDWKAPSAYARPYLDAMLTIDSAEDRYIAEDGRSIVLYFLANASTYRGPGARALKAELQAIIGA